jgi:hypothetical protein
LPIAQIEVKNMTTARLTCPEVLPEFSLEAAQIFSWPKK